MLHVTAIMPVYNEAGDIGDVLASLAAQTFPHSCTTLLVIDGGSKDGTREIAEDWFARHDFDGTVLLNPRRTIPTSLNAGIAYAHPGSIVVRLDGHTTYEPDYIASIVRAFDAAPLTIGCIGGAQTPRPEQRFGLALVTSLYLNPLGLGGAAFRTATEPQVVRGVYLGAWRPGVLQAVGGFDEAWEANEDGELSERLRERGYQTLFVPVRSAYRVKRGPLSVIRQWGRYGYWRAQTLRRHPAAFRIRHLAPPVALIVAVLLLLTPFRAITGVLYALYVAAIWLQRPRGERPLITLAACGFFPACQAAWGAGLLRGFFKRRSIARSA